MDYLSPMMRPALPSQSRRHIDQGECLLYMQLCKTLPCCYFISQLFLLPTLRLLLLAQPIVDYSVYEERPTSPRRLALLNKVTIYYCSCFNDASLVAVVISQPFLTPPAPTSGCPTSPRLYTCYWQNLESTIYRRVSTYIHT